MKKMLTFVTLALPLLVGAQQVWRCGPDGRSYSATPCAEGMALESVEARPAADVDAARLRAAREQNLADTLRRERLAQEATARGNGLAGIGRSNQVKPVPPAPARQRSKKRRPAVEDAGTWRATAPGLRQTKG